MSNKSSGNRAEEEFAKLLSGQGYWVHRLADRVNGQPFDIIAVKDNRAIAFDCKECESGRFEFRRIEPNQETAMKLWNACGNGDVGFAMRAPTGKWFYIPYSECAYLRERGSRSIDVTECIPFQFQEENGWYIPQ